VSTGSVRAGSARVLDELVQQLDQPAGVLRLRDMVHIDRGGLLPKNPVQDRCGMDRDDAQRCSGVLDGTAVRHHHGGFAFQLPLRCHGAVAVGRQLHVGHNECRPDASFLDSGIRGVAVRARRIRPVPDANVRVTVRADLRTPRPQRQPRLRGRHADGHVCVCHCRPTGAGHCAGKQAAPRLGRPGRHDTADGRGYRCHSADRIPVLERQDRAAGRPDTHTTRVPRFRRWRPVQRLRLPDRQLGPSGSADGR